MFKEIISDIIFKQVLKYAYNKNATHVLIKYIKITDIDPFLLKIYDSISKNFSELAQDSNGLPVVKTCISKFNVEGLKIRMIDQLAINVVNLAQNAYGNYALQVALEVHLHFIT